MNMIEVFEKLKTLQDVLVQKYELEVKIADAPKKLSSQDELLARLKKEFIEKNAIYEEVKKKVAGLKNELAEADAAREKSEKGMDSITTHREYEALDKEIKDKTELEQQLRKELQKEEKNLAELNENLKQEEQLISSQETELNASKQSLEEEISSYNAELNSLIEQVDSLKEGIDDEIFFKFERIIGSKQGKGIVAVKGNVCDGCHMILPAQFANEVHTGEKIVFCPYCSRILFYQETDGGEDQYFQIEDAGSLADLDDDFDDLDDDAEDETDDSDDIKNVDFDD